MKAAIRAGQFEQRAEAAPAAGPLTVAAFGAIYLDRYAANKLRSAGTVRSRMGEIVKRFGAQQLAEVRTADIEDFIADLKKPTLLAPAQKIARPRSPATINRYRSLLSHMFTWGVERGYLDRNPFRDGARLLIKAEREDNKRHRRVSPELEAKLLEEAAPHLRLMIIAALDTGMRRGEMLALTWADVDEKPGWLRLRGTTTKSGKTRWVPIGTVRLQGVLDFLRIDAAGHSKPSDARVFSNEAGEPIQGFRTAWDAAVLRAHDPKPTRSAKDGKGRLGGVS